MEKIKLVGNRYVGSGEHPFIVAEIGNNHNGDINIAKKMIATAKKIGVDAVKFQKKDIETAFPKEMLDRSYANSNSFGRTYREHKMALEFTMEQIKEIFDYCKKLDITCFFTPFDTVSVGYLEEIDNPIYKISSFHVTNLKLIEAVCKTGKPIIMSTGMSTTSELDSAVELIRRHDVPLLLLHCVSCYPTDDNNVNLNVIRYLIKRYKCPVGYSGHERGVVICTASIPLGACMIERHFTLDRTMKGPDHAASVEPSGMKLIVRRSKYIYEALGEEGKRVLDCELKNRMKNRGY